MTNGSIQFWDFGVWQLVIITAVLMGAMLAANALRRKIAFLRRSLIPASVLAGFIVLIVSGLYELITGEKMMNPSMLETLTYHGLGLGFVALALRRLDKQRNAKARRDIFNTSLVVVNTYLVQLVAGLIISLALFYMIGSFAASGALLPMGFGQGPGQAYNWGHNFQEKGFDGGTSFGLSIAACGFIVASVGGVIYLNSLRRKGVVKVYDNAAEMERVSAETIASPGEIPMSESMDKLTVQFALIFVAYGITYAFMWGMNQLFCGIPFYDNTVMSLLWGFNFLVGTAAAILVRSVLALLKKKGAMKREYTNNFLLNRISGFMFDLMVVASIAAIDLSAFTKKEFLIPLFSICILGGIVTYIFVRFVTKRLFPDYEHEAFLSLFGMLTGTASTGVILLREIDPNFDTPASGNLIYQNLWAIIFGFPMLLLLGYVANSIGWAWTVLGILTVMFLGMNVLMFRALIFKRKGKKDKAR
ncbi:MAG: hypothetical protein IJC48_08365 [Clostridia bacterium]|nr:hypothetical protein [Clostridia bacterium]